MGAVAVGECGAGVLAGAGVMPATLAPGPPGVWDPVPQQPVVEPRGGPSGSGLGSGPVAGAVRGALPRM